MKKKYEAPEFEIILLSLADVITKSVNWGAGDDHDPEWEGWEEP